MFRTVSACKEMAVLSLTADASRIILETAVKADENGAAGSKHEVF